MISPSDTLVLVYELGGSIYSTSSVRIMAIHESTVAINEQGCSTAAHIMFIIAEWEARQIL